MTDNEMQQHAENLIRRGKHIRNMLINHGSEARLLELKEEFESAGMSAVLCINRLNKRIAVPLIKD